MDLTFDILKHVQYYVGGGVVDLDCKDMGVSEFLCKFFRKTL